MIYLSLGSNLGDRESYLAYAVEELSAIGELKSKSSVYETPPWGKEDQPAFLNMVVALNTAIEPDELLNKVKQIEERLGRKEREHWGPREIDIDILFYDDLRYLSQRLTIPHPLLHERAFVLVPLAEIAPEFIHPVTRLSVQEMLGKIDGRGIYKLSTNRSSQ